MTDNVLWHFCERVYAQPGIEALCLRLQDEQAIKVPLLLWCAWLETQGRFLSIDALQTATQRVQSLSATTVEPIRNLRRNIKSESALPAAVSSDVRDHLLKAELVVEAFLLRELEDFTEQLAAGVEKVPPLNLLVKVMASDAAEDWLGQLREAALRVSRN